MNVDEELRILIAEQHIGEEAERFLKSDVGRLIVGRATQAAKESIAKLKTVNPRDQLTITSLQNEIWRAESVIGWLVEIIEAGNEAVTTYQQLTEENNDG